MYIEVSRILRDIADSKRNIHLCGGTDQSGAERQHELLILHFVGSDHESWPQQSLFVIEKKDRKRVIVDLLLHSRSDFANQFVQFQRGADFKTDVVQQRQQFTVPTLALVHTRVLDSDG